MPPGMAGRGQIRLGLSFMPNTHRVNDNMWFARPSESALPRTHTRASSPVYFHLRTRNVRLILVTTSSHALFSLFG
jgi:hypothetical protein